MKFKVVVILVGVVVLHLLVLAGVCMTGGCKGPEVLSQRSYIPSPEEYRPPGDIDEPGRTLVIDKAPGLDRPVAAPVTHFHTPPVAPPAATELPPFQPVKTETLRYTVTRNDSLWKIGRMYGVSVQELAAFNNLQPDKVLQVGTVLNIPPGGALISPEKLKQLESADAKRPKKRPTTPVPATASPPATATPPVARDGLYTVRSGDSLWKIANAHKVTVAALAAENNLRPDVVLQIGQRLVIPGATAISTPSTARRPAIPDVAGDDTDDIIGRVPDPKLSATPVKGDAVSGDSDSGKKPAAATTSFLLDKTDTIEVSQAISLENFARQFGIKPEDIRKLNPDLSQDGQLEPGKILIVPSAR